jgi:hypothetical protein
LLHYFVPVPFGCHQLAPNEIRQIEDSLPFSSETSNIAGESRDPVSVVENN